MFALLFAAFHVAQASFGTFTAFQVWGLGFEFGVWGLGFGVWGLGFRVEGLGFRVEGLGLGVTPWSLTANDCDGQGVERCCCSG